MNNLKEDFGNINTLGSLTKDILENSIDLDPEIAEIVDKNFWDLF